MARYIDANAISYFTPCQLLNSNTPKGVKVAYKSDIDKIPTADVVEAKHGFWYGVRHYQNEASGQCSECGKQGLLRTYRNGWGIWYIDMPRCPNCGAIMDGKMNFL